MTKRTVEIEDNLKEYVESATEEVKEALLDYLEENHTKDGTGIEVCLNNDLDYSGHIHEIIDGSVPVYTGEIEGLWYLYASEFEQAYENAGFGENPRDNNGMAAIYCYISDQINDWYQCNSLSIIKEWEESDTKEEDK